MTIPPLELSASHKNTETPQPTNDDNKAPGDPKFQNFKVEAIKIEE